MAAKLRAQIPFPSAGKGVFFLFRASDIAALEDEYGIGEYFEKIQIGVDNASARTIETCIIHGLKVVGEDGRPKPASIDIDDIECSLDQYAMPILDALCQAMVGKGYDQVLEEVTEIQREQEKAIQEAAESMQKDPFLESEESSGLSGSDGEQA